MWITMKPALFFVALLAGAVFIEQPALAQSGKYSGVISDGHGHFKGRNANPDGTIAAMDRNNIDKVVIWVKQQGGWKDKDTLAFHAKYPDRVVSGVAFQQKGWSKQRSEFLREVRQKAASGKFKWLGEVSVRGKIGGKLHSPPDSPRLRQVLDIAAESGLPVTFHHNPYRRHAKSFERTGEYETFIEATLAYGTDATIVWAHWCGLSNPEEARMLLKRFANLHCDLAWLHNPQDSVPNSLIGDENRFLPAWKALIEEFPDRFIVGVDSSATPSHLMEYDSRVDKIRTALGGLRPKTARLVATENFHRLIGAK
jgi:predicted TIM-barrel fold metal-dependent hydrolase